MQGDILKTKQAFYEAVKRCQHTDTAPSTYSAYPEGLRHLCHTSAPSFDNSHAPTQLSCWLRGCLMLQAVTVLSEGGPAEGGRVRVRREKRTGSAGRGVGFQRPLPARSWTAGPLQPCRRQRARAPRVNSECVVHGSVEITQRQGCTVLRINICTSICA